MKATILVMATFLALAACEREPPPPVQPAASEDESSVELKIDPGEGSFEFRKEEGAGGDNVDIEVSKE